MEHNVYVCSWSRSADGYVLWVKAAPKIRGAGATYQEAEDRLIEAIHDAGGAMQAVMEFVPPLPKSTLEERYCTPEIVLVVGDDGFVTDQPRLPAVDGSVKTLSLDQMREALRKNFEDRGHWYDSFYEKPMCRKCQYASSRRSDKPLTLREAPSRFDGAFGRVGRECKSSHQIVSDEFLSLLTAEERGRLELQSVAWKGRRIFHELIGPAGPPLVAIAGRKLSGWRCEECQFRLWGHRMMDFDIHSFVATVDLPSPLPSVFTVGAFPEIQLAVTGSRWRELVGRKGTRGFISSPLGVAPDAEVVREPELPTREEQLRENKRRNEEWRRTRGQSGEP